MPNDILRVGIIQTSLDYEAAWHDKGEWDDTVRMSYFEERRAKKEIRHYLASLHSLEKKPDIVLLPELSVPLGYENKLKRSAEAMESIVIAGLDYKVESKTQPSVSNEAIVIVPRRLRGKKIARKTEVRRIGKTYAAPEEKNKLDALGVNFKSHPTVWLFESPDFRTFSVAVCYDFIDLDRIVLYRNKIQTLFVLAYNRDITSFDHIAQSISRTVFCNVIICNCGYYGGSLAVSPYRESYKRTVYQHSGSKLTTAQIGDEIFAYQRRVGYLGRGVVTSEAVMAKDFLVEGKPLLELPLKGAMALHKDDPELAEYVVGVQWKAAFSMNSAKTFKGAFANQNVVCKLRDEQTIDFLKSEFK